jgi:hypothetical protein
MNKYRNNAETGALAFLIVIGMFLLWLVGSAIVGLFWGAFLWVAFTHVTPLFGFSTLVLTKAQWWLAGTLLGILVGAIAPKTTVSSK